VPCLLNCSNNGYCDLDSTTNEKLICSCDQYHSGESCNQDLRKCSNLNQCLNNGICTNIQINMSYYDFNCTCQDPYYGRHCELKINKCKNIDCSRQGICIQNETTTYCNCFKGYSGRICEIISVELKKIKTINNVSAYVSIIFMILFFILIILFDLLYYWKSIKIYLKNKFKPKQNQTI